MHGQPLSKTVDARLGRGITDDARERAHGAHRRDIEDDAFALFGHLFAENLAGKNRAQKVQIEDEAKSLFGYIEEREVGPRRRLRMIAARTVHQTIHTAKLFCNSRERALQIILLERIAFEDVRAARPFNLREQSLGLLAIARKHRNNSAAADERLNHVAAKHARSARHDYRAPREVVHLSQPG